MPPTEKSAVSGRLFSGAAKGLDDPRPLLNIYCGFKHLERNGIVPLEWARRSEGLRSPKRRMEGSWAGQLRCLSLALWSEAYVVYLTRFSFIFWSGERK